MIDPALVRTARAALRWIARWPHAFIVAFLAIQLALPLYYYGVRRDKHDERFAWRMFSSVRMTTCDVSMWVGVQPVELQREFHDAWIALARRGRVSVVEAMGAHLCKEHPGQEVRAELTCRPVRGEPYPLASSDLCTIPL